jgi:hypothetical protein
MDILAELADVSEVPKGFLPLGVSFISTQGGHDGGNRLHPHH